MNRAFVILAVVLVAGAPPARAGLDKKTMQATVKEFNQAPRPVRPDFLAYPGYTLKLADADYSCLVPAALRRLALAGERFTIRKVQTKRDHFRVELEMRGKRRLKITVYDHGELSQSFLDQGLPRLLNDVFDFGAPPPPVAFIGNRESSLVHHDRCNHLPPAALRQNFATHDAALAAGLRDCPICFGTTPSLPYPDYLADRTSGLEAAKAFELVYPASPDTALQARLARLGQVVLDGWPLELAGFEYDFRVVQAEQPLAASFSTGIVVMSDTMLKAAEADEEILFVLAHEIAHCELLLPPRSPFADERPFPMEPGYGPYLTWISTQQMVADLVAVCWFQSQDGDRWQLLRARSALAKVQQAVGAFEDVSGTPAMDYSLHERLWLFEPARFQPGDLRQVFAGEDAEGDVRYELRPLGLMDQDDGVVPLFLLTTTDYQEKAHYGEYVAEANGKFEVDGGRSVSFFARRWAAVPGYTTLMIGEIFSGPSVTPASISTLTNLKVIGLDGVKRWRHGTTIY
jgi:hypothetical protein